MEKVCADWPAKAFDEQLVSGKYWDEFAENTKAAATELIHAGTWQEAEQLLQGGNPAKHVVVRFAVGYRFDPVSDAPLIQDIPAFRKHHFEQGGKGRLHFLNAFELRSDKCLCRRITGQSLVLHSMHHIVISSYSACRCRADCLRMGIETQSWSIIQESCVVFNTFDELWGIDFSVVF